ncbi:MAG: SUMF1/EgtB/PvdO family nonheme iron enzyme [Bauldia sp.]
MTRRVLFVLAALAGAAALMAASGQRAADGSCAGVETRIGPQAESTCLVAGRTFVDCEGCPKMVVIPAGRFTMGSAGANVDPQETPAHPVAIAAAIAVGAFEVTRGEFAAYAAEDRDYRPDWCWVRRSDGEWDDKAGASFADPGVDQTADHPAVCVSWYDAKAYVAWLSRRSGQPYRLLSEAEWEYAARAGSVSSWPFDERGGACAAANAAPVDSGAAPPNCRDSFSATAPVGSFPANPLGLYDMAGNAAEWVEDCFHATYAGAPSTAIPWNFEGCLGGKVVRGGSWVSDLDGLRSAKRQEVVPGDRYSVLGFRVARWLFPVQPRP